MVDTVTSSITTVMSLVGDTVGMITGNWIMMTLIVCALVGTAIGFVFRLIRVRKS